jgi:hypothetical protein
LAAGVFRGAGGKVLGGEDFVIQSIAFHRILSGIRNRSLRSRAFFARTAPTTRHEIHEPLWKVTPLADMLKQKCGDSTGGQGRDYLKRMLDKIQPMKSLLTALPQCPRLPIRTNPFLEETLRESTKRFSPISKQGSKNWWRSVGCGLPGHSGRPNPDGVAFPGAHRKGTQGSQGIAPGSGCIEHGD